MLIAFTLFLPAGTGDCYCEQLSRVQQLSASYAPGLIEGKNWRFWKMNDSLVIIQRITDVN